MNCIQNKQTATKKNDKLNIKLGLIEETNGWNYTEKAQKSN